MWQHKFFLFSYWQKLQCWEKERVVWVTDLLKGNGGYLEIPEKEHVLGIVWKVVERRHRRDSSTTRDCLNPKEVSDFCWCITELCWSLFCVFFFFCSCTMFFFGTLHKCHTVFYFWIPTARNLLNCQTGFAQFLDKNRKVSSFPVLNIYLFSI